MVTQSQLESALNAVNRGSTFKQCSCHVFDADTLSCVWSFDVGANHENWKTSDYIGRSLNQMSYKCNNSIMRLSTSLWWSCIYGWSLPTPYCFSFHWSWCLYYMMIILFFSLMLVGLLKKDAVGIWKCGVKERHACCRLNDIKDMS